MRDQAQGITGDDRQLILLFKSAFHRVGIVQAHADDLAKCRDRRQQHYRYQIDYFTTTDRLSRPAQCYIALLD